MWVCRRKKDHGRAEAALLAMWGIMLSSSHLAAREPACTAPDEVEFSGAFDEDEQTQHLRKLARAS